MQHRYPLPSLHVSRDALRAAFPIATAGKSDDQIDAIIDVWLELGAEPPAPPKVWEDPAEDISIAHAWRAARDSALALGGALRLNGARGLA